MTEFCGLIKWIFEFVYEHWLLTIVFMSILRCDNVLSINTRK